MQLDQADDSDSTFGPADDVQPFGGIVGAEASAEVATLPAADRDGGFVLGVPVAANSEPSGGAELPDAEPANVGAVVGGHEPDADGHDTANGQRVSASASGRRRR